MQTAPSTRYHVRVTLLTAFGLLSFELLVLAGGLWWTFRRAQLPVGWLSSLGLALVVGVGQVSLMAVVDAALRFASDLPVLEHWSQRVHPASVFLGAAAVAVAAPLALKRYLNLDARWTRALSRELLAGFVASTFAGIVVMGALLIVVLIIAALAHGH